MIFSFFSLALTSLCLFVSACQSKKIIVVQTANNIEYIKVGVDKKDCLSMTDKECRAFTLINNIRENNNLPPLLAVENCIEVSRYNSQLMHSSQNLSHEQKDETWIQRVKKFKAIGKNMAENIALSPNAQRLADQWMNSEDHKKNILDPRFNITGMGFHKNYWTQCFIEAQTPILAEPPQKEIKNKIGDNNKETENEIRKAK